MELKIYSPSQDGFIRKIEWNYEELRQEIQAKAGLYKNIVYTESQIKDAKSDRAKMNKFINALESKRKEIKKACLYAYEEEFEPQILTIVNMLRESASSIDNQVKAFEERAKEEKKQEIISYYENLNRDFPSFEQIFQKKWLNASISISMIQKEIDQALQEIDSSLNTIDNLQNYGFEAKEMYKATLNFQKAIEESSRLQELAKKKEAYEKETSYKVTKEVSIEEEEVRQWIGFEAFLSTREAHELAFF